MTNTAYNYPENKDHLGLLYKFILLKGETLKGKDKIKHLLKDEYVSYKHNLHDLIRGWYKPKEFEYILSCLATENDENYGPQIVWENRDLGIYKEILLSPPNGIKDSRKQSDIKAFRNNLKNNIPVGILENTGKGQNRILGVGLPVEELKDGRFRVVPIEGLNYSPQQNMDINYFSFKTAEKDFIDKFTADPKSEIEFKSIYHHEERTNVGDDLLP